jgi:MFS family permease
VGGLLVARPAFAGRNFILICSTHLAGYMGNWMLVPVLPLFLSAQGYNEAFIGLILAAYNVTSFSARPIFGRLVDVGRPRSALIGACALLGTTAFGYLVPSTAFLFVVRAAHGFGWAGLNAVGTAWIAALAPVARRAEAMGYYTMSQSLGTAIAPAIGIALLTGFDAGAAFTTSALLGMLAFGAAVLTRAPSVPARQTSHTPSVGQGWLGRFVEPSVLSTTALLTLVQLNQPVLSSFAPLYFRSIGVTGVEWYFVGQGAMSIVSRAALGSWADRIGRSPSLLVGFMLQLAGLVLLWQSKDLLPLVAGGGVYTLGSGIAQPSMYALAADRADPARRGAAMATYTMGFQLGSGIGAVVGGLIIEQFGYSVMYACSLVPLVAAIGSVSAVVVGGTGLAGVLRRPGRRTRE